MGWFERLDKNKKYAWLLDLACRHSRVALGDLCFSGILEQHELRAGLTHLHPIAPILTSAEVDMILSVLDPTGSGRVTFNDFQAAMSKVLFF